jgi:hypothetical protein
VFLGTLLLLLLGRREAALAATSHDTAEEAVARSNGGRLLLVGAGVLGRASHASIGVALASFSELMTEHGDLLLPFLLKGHMRLLHGVDFFANHLHFANLGVDFAHNC